MQELIDNILTVTNDFNYTGGSTEKMPTFLKLTGVQSTTIKGAGEYRLDNLISAGNIVLDNTFKSKVTIVHLGALTTYTKLSDNAGVSGVVDMGSATEFHLTSVAIPVGGKLDITIKEGGVLALTALTGLNAVGTVQVMDLDFDGPAAVSLANIAKGAITLDNVATATISDFYGAIDINAGVETLTVTKGVTLDISDAADLTTATINMVTDYDPALTTTALATAVKVSSYKDVTFASQDLETATVSGKVGTLTVNAQNNLTSLTVSGHATKLVATNNNDLTTLVVTGATIGDITADNNDNMINLTLDHTSYVTTAKPGVSISVDLNADLVALTIDANNVGILSIQNNDDLASITAGSTLTSIGTATATINIDNNDLTAVKASDGYNATPSATVADAGTYDVGTSGMSSWKTYFAAAEAAPTVTGVKVFFDTISSYVTQVGSASAAFTDQAVPTNTYVDSIYAVVFATKTVVTTTGNTVNQATTAVWPVGRDLFFADRPLVANEGVIVAVSATQSVTFKQGATFNAVAVNTVTQLVDYINADTTIKSAGFTVTAARDAWKQTQQNISWTYSNGMAASASATGLVYWTFGSDPTNTAQTVSGTASLAVNEGQTHLATKIAAVITALGAWNAAASSNTITFSANVSGTGDRDYSPLAHAVPTLVISSDSTTSTLSLAGNYAGHISAGTESISLEVASNTIASASGTFNLAVTKTNYNGLRVTLSKDDTTSVFPASAGVIMTSYSGGLVKETVNVTTADVATYTGTAATAQGNMVAAASGGNGTGAVGGTILLASPANIATAASQSATLNYVAAYADVESPVTTTATGSSTDRTGWL